MIDVNEKKNELTQYLQSKSVSSPIKAKQCISQMLALSIVPAYKNEEGKAVIREGQFRKACEIMKDHEVAGELAQKYRYQSERKELLVDYYIEGEGKRPVPEEDLQQVQQMAQQKNGQPKNSIRM